MVCMLNFRKRKQRKPDEKEKISLQKGQQMRIMNLVENELGESGCEAAHGLSFYVETDNHKLLFDSSPSELVIRNARKLGVDLTAIDTVILSHGHYDHSGGILPFVEINPRAKIYMQYNASRPCNRWFPSYEAY